MLLVNINGERFASLLLLRQRRDLLRQDREYEPPEISMRSVSPHWLNVQCTVPKHASGFRIFVNCPALQSPCYENCLPIKTCGENSSRGAECLPDRTAVNCTESTNPDGSRVTSLWIDKRNERLHGSWICTSQGIKSSIVNVSKIPIYLSIKCLILLCTKICPFMLIIIRLLSTHHSKSK